MGLGLRARFNLFITGWVNSVIEITLAQGKDLKLTHFELLDSTRRLKITSDKGFDIILEGTYNKEALDYAVGLRKKTTKVDIKSSKHTSTINIRDDGKNSLILDNGTTRFLDDAERMELTPHKRSTVVVECSGLYGIGHFEFATTLRNQGHKVLIFVPKGSTMLEDNAKSRYKSAKY